VLRTKYYYSYIANTNVYIYVRVRGKNYARWYVISKLTTCTFPKGHLMFYSSYSGKSVHTQQQVVTALRINSMRQRVVESKGGNGTFRPFMRELLSRVRSTRANASLWKYRPTKYHTVSMTNVFGKIANTRVCRMTSYTCQMLAGVQSIAIVYI